MQLSTFEQIRAEAVLAHAQEKSLYIEMASHTGFISSWVPVLYIALYYYIHSGSQGVNIYTLDGRIICIFGDQSRNFEIR